ncbi:MAG TPA: hypothetical protein DCS43_03530, partial [Verrucomicrobia bacterium]|nr:hypothetical protein [Verrucomicrobiota bacterium]
NIRHKKQSSAGMTLVEIAIATFIIALGFTGIFGTATHIVRTVRITREETKATLAAQHALEIVKTYSWIELSLWEAKGESSFDITGNREFADLPSSSCTLTVTTATGEVDRLRKVTARVRWKRLTGDDGERELTSLIARKKRLR